MRDKEREELLNNFDNVIGKFQSMLDDGKLKPSEVEPVKEIIEDLQIVASHIENNW